MNATFISPYRAAVMPKKVKFAGAAEDEQLKLIATIDAIKDELQAGRIEVLKIYGNPHKYQAAADLKIKGSTYTVDIKVDQDADGYQADFRATKGVISRPEIKIDLKQSRPDSFGGGAFTGLGGLGAIMGPFFQYSKRGELPISSGDATVLKGANELAKSLHDLILDKHQQLQPAPTAATVVAPLEL